MSHPLPEPSGSHPYSAGHPARTPSTQAPLRSSSPASGDRFGRISLIAGAALLLGMSVLPAPYAVRSPGPVLDAIGEVPATEEAKAREVITIDGAPSYEPDAGEINILTVQITGSPAATPTWLLAFASWVNPSQDVLPIEVYYPEGVTVEERTREVTAQMTSSQDLARAAALTELGYEVPTEVAIAGLTDDSPAAGMLEEGDVLRAVNGSPITSMDQLRDAVREAGEKPVEITIERDGEPKKVSVTPQMRETEEGEVPVIGVIGGEQFQFPVDVDIAVGDIGGPSAGLMLSLAIIDKMTPGNLTGGKVIAGTGTITPDGQVGVIGGIREKLYAARDAGADAFFAPVGNCGELSVPAAPTDVPVYAVETLGEARTVLDAIATGASTDQFRTCRDVVEASDGGEPASN